MTLTPVYWLMGGNIFGCVHLVLPSEVHLIYGGKRKPTRFIHYIWEIWFTGPKRLSLIPSTFLLTDINLFIDSGVAFDNFSDFSNGKLIDFILRDEDGNIILDVNGNPVYEARNAKPTLITSVGVSL